MKILLCTILFFGVTTATTLYDTLVKLAQAKYPQRFNELTKNEIASIVRESIFKASELLGLDNFEDEDCEVDYSPFCPQGWIHSGDGIHCQVALGHDYKGVCPRVMDFSGKTPLDKSNLAKTCSLNWPCKTAVANVPEADFICPQDWIDLGDSCQPTDAYTGPCTEPLALVGKTRADREEIAKRCRLFWTPKAELLNPKFNFNVPCPLGWSQDQTLNEVEVKCKLDPGQTSPCGDSLSFKDLEDKRRKTLKCSLLWPFKNRDFGGPYTKCPHGWKLQQFGEEVKCLAPIDYEGPCQLRFDPKVFTRLPKSLWSVICGIDLITLEDEKPSKEPGAPIKMTKAIYDDGAIEDTFRIIKRRRISPKTQQATVLDNQLTALEKLKSQTKDPNFLTTLNHTIQGLKARLSGLQTPMFLQLAHEYTHYEQCPYEWQQYGTYCVAPETYRKIVPECPYVVDINNLEKLAENPKCRISKRSCCVEDFARYACPKGWRRRRFEFDGDLRTLCIAPKSFRNAGQCGSKVDFTGCTAAFKRRWSYICDVEFPCYDPNARDACVENFFWECPAEWTLDKTTCVAPTDYHGTCEGKINISELNSNEKKLAFSRKCQAPWPCVNFCMRNYSNDCPDGWVRERNKCVYEGEHGAQVQGPCGTEIEINTNWNDYAKQECEFKCLVKWPCKLKSDLPVTETKGLDVVMTRTGAPVAASASL